MPNHRYFISDFVEIQRKSFFDLLEMGIVEEFSKRNPISNVSKNLELFFYPEYYKLSKPEYTIRQAILKSRSYASKFYIPVQLTDKKNKIIKLKWVLLGNLPLMTKRGHFLINGAARVIVNQIIRSPGIYFQQKIHEVYVDKWTEKPIETHKRYYADIICLRGTWLRIEIDKDKLIWAQMKKGPKIPVFWLLIGMGLSERYVLKSLTDGNRLLTNFSNKLKQQTKNEYVYVQNPPEAWKQLYKIFSSTIKVDQNKPNETTENDSIEILLKDVDSTFSLNKKNESISVSLKADKYGVMNTESFSKFSATNLESVKKQASFLKKSELILSKKLNKKINEEKKKAELGRKWLFKKFMNPRSYDLGKQGRISLNKKLGLSTSLKQLTLTGDDILATTDYLLKLEKSLKAVDDIDHLKNRRVRTSGQLIQIQLAVGLVRLEKIVREKMGKTTTPNIKTLVQTKVFNGALKEFFGSSPLSQFMDQINPLSELTHKRRLSSLGPGGVTRDNATLEIRGIHPSHYGRICPIETPEGKNTGLVNSMTTYAKVNSEGLIETPFYKVYQGQVQKNLGICFLSAEQEEKVKVAPGDLSVSALGFLPNSLIPVRVADEFTKIHRDEIQFLAVSPIQMISVATSLIPFLEHDDANRALMGSNMQRQAVPLMRPERPIVGTGLEVKAVSDSSQIIQAKSSGFVAYVSAEKIIVYALKNCKLSMSDV
uniref:DNA-directed RNA polymerase n=1 Tax=Atractomorpha echinata TaxID=52677 RepID=A0A140GIQ4_9CHLO|nr:RNA polymerase beta subunit [Atractomorpha echinata]